MAGRTRARITDEMLLDRALGAFLTQGELKESQLYEITGTKVRVPALLD